MARLTLQGDKELIRSLEALPQKVRKRVIRGALRKGMTPILQVARKTVPQQKREGSRGRKVAGLLRKSLGHGKAVLYPDGRATHAIGPRTGKKFKGTSQGSRIEIPAKYAHFSEFGSEHQKGQRWMTRARDRKKRTALLTLKIATFSGIAREVNKLRLKGGR